MMSWSVLGGGKSCGICGQPELQHQLMPNAFEGSGQSQAAKGLEQFLDKKAEALATSGEPPPGRVWQDALRLPDERLFKEGGCNAFAIELAAAYAEAGIPAEIWYLRAQGDEAQQHAAQHVVVKTPEGYFDVDFGPHSEPDLIGRWSEKGAEIIVKLPNLALLQTPVPATPGIDKPSHSWLHLCTVPEFLTEAGRRARAFIAANRPSFGLP